MKEKEMAEVLEKISDKKYSIKNKCTYKKNKKICNFYIKKIVTNDRLDTSLSFAITLESGTGKHTATIPECYLNDPSGWLICYFDEDDFYSEVSREEFNRTINEIIRLLKQKGYCKYINKTMGWDIELIQRNIDQVMSTRVDFLSFDKLEDYYFYYDEEKIPKNHLYTYSELIDRRISSILFSYMLLALLDYFELLGKNIHPDFVIILSGSTEENRRKTALFFTNLYNRNLGFGKNDYSMFHITNSDSYVQMYTKATYAKDCVLIAFEPDKKHLKHLVEKIYGIRAVDEKKPVRNMCMITTNSIEKVTDKENLKSNIINIRLPDEYTFDPVKKYFNNDDKINCKEDELMENIYCYIGALVNQLIVNPEYIKNKFTKHKEWFYENSHFKMNREKFTDESSEAALLLSFAYKLYVSEYKQILKNAQKYTNKDEYETLRGLLTISNEIIDEVRDAFLINGESTNTTFDKITIMCKKIDSYFCKTGSAKGEANYKNKKKIKIIGEEKTDIGVKVWADKEYIYIRPDDIKEILQLQKCSTALSMKMKVLMSEMDIIKKYVKNDGKPEYSVHLPKVPECDKSAASLRYIAFKREICRNYNLFKNIEEIILGRCQIDVKQEKNKDNEEE